MTSLPSLPRDARLALGLILLLAAGRLLLAALTPLSPDEAYYAMWARSLSPGYFDHPPMIALFIRAGTAIFGETPLGIRLFCALAALPATFFTWRAGAILLADARGGLLAALFFNLTLIGYFGMAVATPDAPLVLFASAMLYFAARLTEDRSTASWIAIGIATGLAFQSKYSAALVAAGFSLAVLILPEWRRQLVTPRPWLALGVALLVFAPNIAWNASYDWATFLKQGSRVAIESGLSPRYALELMAAQIGLATPFLLALAIAGMLPFATAAYRNTAARRLMLSLILVPTAYFLFHALRARVEGNWPSPIYPALAISAAAAGTLWRGSAGRFMTRAALFTALAVALLGSGYILARPVTVLGRKDPILRLTGGWDTLAGAIAATADRVGAKYILTYDYQLNAELAWHIRNLPVAQGNERGRYAMLREPEPTRFHGTGLVVARDDIGATLKLFFPAVEPLGTADQRRGDALVARFYVYRVELPPAP